MIYLSIVKQLDHYKWFFFLRGQPSPPLIGNNNNNNIFALPNIGLLQIILTWLSMLEYKPKIMSTAPFTGPISMLSSIKWQIHPAIPWNHKIHLRPPVYWFSARFTCTDKSCVAVGSACEQSGHKISSSLQSLQKECGFSHSTQVCWRNGTKIWNGMCIKKFHCHSDREEE